MSDAVLDDEQLAALLCDLRACAQIDEVILKAGAGRVPDQATSPTLEEIGPLLRARHIRGVQVRYRYNGALWWDTLMPLPRGVRLVRICHDHMDATQH